MNSHWVRHQLGEFATKLRGSIGRCNQRPLAQQQPVDHGERGIDFTKLAERHRSISRLPGIELRAARFASLALAIRAGSVGQKRRASAAIEQAERDARYRAGPRRR